MINVQRMLFRFLYIGIFKMLFLCIVCIAKTRLSKIEFLNKRKLLFFCFYEPHQEINFLFNEVSYQNIFIVNFFIKIINFF